MDQLILIVHVVVAAAIVGLILLQQGKGAEMGASFGAGASQTVFGSSGSGNFFSRATAVLAAVFFATSFGLAIAAKNSMGISEDDFLPALQEVQAPAVDSEIPALDASASDVPVIEAPANDVPVVDAPVSEIPAVPSVEEKTAEDIPVTP